MISPSRRRHRPVTPRAYLLKAADVDGRTHEHTIYGVIHAAGGRTAWADKHAVYAAVSGPTGTPIPSNVDDYYAPDVNSDVIALPGISTATGLSCGAIPDPNGGAWTDSFLNIQCYDQLKVNAVVNWIHGRTHY